MIRRRIILGAALVVVFGIGWKAGRGGAHAGDLYKNLDLFVEILHRIQDNYVDPVEPQKLVNGAVKGMLQDLDPYSQFLDDRSYQNLQSVTRGSFSGIGVEVSIRDNHPTVISPIEGGPAWALGVRSGDVIVRVDGKETGGLTLDDVSTLLRGAEGTHVQISIRREGEADDVEYTVERREISTPSVRYAFVVGNGIGYLRLAAFSESSGGEVRAALDRLRAQGAKRLVLDLRSNPGGLLDQAVGVTEQFVKSGTLVVATRGRATGQDKRYLATQARPLLDWPMVVLVDGASASASEIVAGALQDLDRALLVGTTTFGKGSVQSLYPLRGGAMALKLTTARYFTPSGRSIHRLRSDTTADLGDDETPSAEPETPRSDSLGPVFHTAAGRLVYGGGGIRPDVEVLRDTLPSLTNRVEGRGLTFRFANRWVNTHPAWTVKDPLSPELWKDLASFLTSEKLQTTDAELAGERASLGRALRRELARRLAGDAEAARVALDGDPAFARAVEVLGRSRTARDVFAAARLPGESLPATARREPATVR